MKQSSLPLALGAVVTAVVLFLAAPAFTRPAAPQDPPDEQGDLAEMMRAAQRYTQPGEHHELLGRFVGDWDLQVSMIMGGQRGPAEGGSATMSWLMPGRFIQSKASFGMMGMQAEGFWIMGYDNFKRSYVTCHMSSLETALRYSEGDLTPDGNALIFYGTVDEYLTGEHDKMAKSVFRFVSEDEIVQEIHDLAIGETGTQVIEIRFTRQ